jgi:galactose-3-O-sulfotransferase
MASEVLLHLHIPKVGGTTLRNWIFERAATTERWKDHGGLIQSGIYYFPWDVIAPADTALSSSDRAVLARDDVNAVVGHFWFGIHRYLGRPYTYVTLLRDPADRLVSLYYLLVALPDRYNFKRLTGFHDFVTRSDYRETYNDQTRRIAGAEPGVGGLNREVLERAKSNLRECFSVVGTMERFDETLLLLNRQFGWTDDTGTYFPGRQNPVRPEVSSLPDATLAAIRERNALDYELYEFADSLLADQVARAGPELSAQLESLRGRQLALYERLAWKQSAEWEDQKRSQEKPADAIAVEQ